MKKFKWIILGFVLLLIGLNIKLIIYGVRQGLGQYKVLTEAQPLDSFLNDHQYPDSLKLRVKQLKQIKSFANASYNLPAEGRYNKIFDQQGDDILWVVTAAETYQMENYYWWFPLLGKVSYKGFFRLDLAEELKDELDAAGYDTRLRPVDAWSTLGWFEDPLLSKMLERSEARLAEVVFHELIHDVIYIKDSTTFNENLASFFGKQITKDYLQSQQVDSTEVVSYLNRIADQELLYCFMNEWKERLATYYQNMEPSLDAKQKAELKQQQFDQLRVDLQALQFNDTSYPHFVLEDSLLNNAHLLAYDRYGGYQRQLQEELSKVYGNDLKEMLLAYRDKFGD